MTEAETLAWLEAYAPVLCFNAGEDFYPTQVEAYLQACSLHRHIPFWMDENLTSQWESRPPRWQGLGHFNQSQPYLQLIDPTWGERLTPAFFVLILALLTATGWILRGLAGAASAAGAAMTLILWMRVTSTRRGFTLLFSALLVLVFSATLGLALRPISPILAAVCASALLIWLGLGFLAVSWRQLPGLVIRVSSKLNHRRRDAAQQRYQAWHAANCVYPYYGRVVQEGRWTTLQYHFFYAFNDWAHRTGLNYHEGDWETVMVFLKDGHPAPYGVGYSAHHQGEFRPWADADKVANTYHPRVFVACGSHANYPKRGVILPSELLPEWLRAVDKFFELARERAAAARTGAPAPLPKLARRQPARPTTIPVTDPRVQAYQSKVRVGQRNLPAKNQVTPPAAEPDEDLVDPEWFQETALGTGKHIGFGSETKWQPVLITEPEPGWVDYRGLWGVRTWLTDESGPPGPKWDRAGRCAQFPRLRWEAPLRWLRQLQQSAGRVDPDLPA